MSGEHEKWNECLPWYANGTLDGPTSSALEAHLRECPTCCRELAAWQRLSAGVRAQPLPTLRPSARRRLVNATQPREWSSASLLPLLLRSQLPIIRGEIWLASALVLVLGTLVTLAVVAPGSEALLFVLVAPIVAAVGIAFIYGPSADPALEVELAAPVPPHLVLLCRVLLVFGFDLALALAGSLALALLRPGVSLWPLVATWLAPMAFLSALSLLLSVLFFDPGLGSLASMVLWVLHGVGRTLAPESILALLPDLTATPVRPWLWAAAILFGGTALWAAGREERWLRRRA
jgi:hypothetical protein